MRLGLRVRWGAGTLAMGAASICCAQGPYAARPRAQALLVSGESAPVSVQPLSVTSGEFTPGNLVREIDDPHTGDRWLLMRDGQYPGGPGRLVRVAAGRRISAATSLPSADAPQEARFLPIIRAGDRLIVEEHTRVVDAVLEARALAPAALGAELEARLTIGGRVVRAVALGPGRAALEADTGERP